MGMGREKVEEKGGGISSETIHFVSIPTSPSSRTYKVDLAGKLSIFREPSNSASGMMFNAAGELVALRIDVRRPKIN